MSAHSSNNVTNRNYKVGANALEHEIGTNASIFGAPRMFGVELRYRFGADANRNTCANVITNQAAMLDWVIAFLYLSSCGLTFRLMIVRRCIVFMRVAYDASRRGPAYVTDDPQTTITGNSKSISSRAARRHAREPRRRRARLQLRRDA